MTHPQISAELHSTNTLHRLTSLERCPHCNHVMEQPTKPKTVLALDTITSIDNAKCPHCRSLVWVKVHRSWWQRLSHPQQNLCFCRDCRQYFWQSAW